MDSTLNEGHTKGQNEVSNVEDEDSVDITMEERPLRRITRARESSFSIDSDEDYYYSSPEDEEEFMSREFIKDYDNLRNDRLIDMSKAELINEYLQMEDKIEALEKRLSRQSSQTEQIQVENTVKEEDSSKKAMEDTIQKFQNEIKRLESENDKLKLVQAVKIPFGPGGGLPPGTCSTSCSSCSESDSESDSNSDSDDTSDSEDSENESEPIVPKSESKQVFDTILSEKQAALQQQKSRQIDEVEGDTGYESGHSNKPVTNGSTSDTLEAESIDPNNTNEEKDDSKTNGDVIPDDELSDPESCPELISVNCITSTSL